MIVTPAPDARRPELTRMFRFSCVGSAGTVLALMLFAVFHALGVDYRVSAALGISISYAANFFANRRWTFHAHAGSLAPQAIRFAAVSTVATIVNVIAVHMLHESVHIAEFGAEVLAVVIATPVSYLGNRWWTFEGERRPVGDLEAA